jgi:NADH-quinone oxidoreductase subunit L
MNFLSTFWWIPLYPLVGSALIAILRRYPGVIACGAVLLSFLHTLAALSGDRSGVVTHRIHEWMPGIPFAFQFDELSGMMALMITGIGLLIHLYSTGYMRQEEGYWRYFAFLNLFLFFMLVLVLANNLVLLFAGWEGVGLASYLLIGFHHDRQAVNRCATKAFLYNRIGDAGFLVGTLILLAQVGSVEFSVLRQVEGSPWTLAAALCLALGATGKSAQMPLFVWLPDAMVGPTPVSALIHAATMVTGGIYLFARLAPLYAQAPEAGAIVAAVGASTALPAATVALVEHDIKRILAYSTVSQLGLMFLACGLGATDAALFHVATHAFFKALLFLCAGNIIHGLRGEQDIRYMGGLRQSMPWTFRLMTVGLLALAGIPGLAGFFSKDAILIAAEGNLVLLGMALAVSFLTALYSGRLLWRVFLGPAQLRDPDHAAHDAHGVMLYSLWPLAAGSIVAGYFGAHHDGGIGIMALSGVLAITGFLLGRLVVVPQPLLALFENKWYVNSLYEAIGVRLLGRGGATALSGIDRHGIDLLSKIPKWIAVGFAVVGGWFDRLALDGLVRLSAILTIAASYPVRLVQTGRVQNYLLAAALVFAVVLGWQWLTATGAIGSGY